jgi:hypothetical protein
VSPHWPRHAHSSHALDAISLVRDTLGARIDRDDVDLPALEAEGRSGKYLRL